MLYRNTNMEIIIMFENRKAQALETLRSLLARPETRSAAEEQYEELLRIVEEYLKLGFINRDERKDLVTEATKRYARAVASVGERA